MATTHMDITKIGFKQRSRVMNADTALQVQSEEETVLRSEALS
ncbi:MAG TPA: hypothetical protein VK638_13375 [Edaphobacter sp.]|nr:hypothetical protein [Edaphobacter sp.]